MVTNWENHWDNISQQRTSYPSSMFRTGMAENKIEDGTETLFIKREKTGAKSIEGCWVGSVDDIKKTSYDGNKFYFTVNIEEKIPCPEKYKNYSIGWHCEGKPSNKAIIKKESMEDELIKKVKSYTNNCWLNIEKDFEISKREFSRKINFVGDKFKKEIIFRDVEQAFILLKMGFKKPALIIAGGVIEELLRLYLKFKKVKPNGNTFSEYIKCCEKYGLLKDAIRQLSDSVRCFRNIVHLKEEQTKRYSISKANATNAVASIFTIVNDF